MSSPTPPPNPAPIPDRLSEQELAMVLSRFESWAAQSAAQPKKAAPRARELSYDEALRVSQHHPSVPVPNLAAAKQPRRTAPANTPSAVPRSAEPSKPIVAATEPPAGSFLSELEAALKAATPTATEAKANLKECRRRTADAGTVSVSVRMTATEREILRADAAAESLTPSAYLRRSASEVKVLRHQLAQAVDTLKRFQEKPSRVLVEEPTESWLQRVSRMFHISRSRRFLA